MQVLKEEVNNMILEVAKKLFLEKGFSNTTMKEIAVSAGVSKSNLYNYFASKEKIYETLVSPVLVWADKFMDAFYTHNLSVEFGSNEFIEIISINVYENIIKNKYDFLLLMNSAEGTDFTSFKSKMTDELTKHFHEDMSILNKNYNHVAINVIAGNLIEGLINIVDINESDDAIKEDILVLFKYHVSGMLGLFA